MWLRRLLLQRLYVGRDGVGVGGRKGGMGGMGHGRWCAVEDLGGSCVQHMTGADGRQWYIGCLKRARSVCDGLRPKRCMADRSDRAAGIDGLAP